MEVQHLKFNNWGYRRLPIEIIDQRKSLISSSIVGRNKLEELENKSWFGKDKCIKLVTFFGLHLHYKFNTSMYKL